jgi:ribonuclease-3
MAADTNSPKDLQELIGYAFKDTTLLEDALTRIAFLNDQQKKEEEKSMGPLATVGDAVLGCVVACKLYSDPKNRTKQKLTELRSKDVRRERTKTFAEKNHLGNFINWGKGEKQEKIETKGTTAYDTVTEALIGAVFLDAQDRSLNGITEVGKMLDKLNFFD